MKDDFDEKAVRRKVRESISNYCHMRVRLEMCEPDECDSCPMNDAYDMAREDDEGFEEFE